MGIEERKQTVLIIFEHDKKIWKRVPFNEISRMGDGTLRPLWKPDPVVASCPSRPTDFEKVGGDDLEVAVVVEGPQGPPPKEEGEEEDATEGEAPAAQDSAPPSAASAAPAAPAASSTTIDDESEEERQAQMARRMRRMEKQKLERAKSKSRSPKRKSVCYVPGHCI